MKNQKIIQTQRITIKKTVKIFATALTFTAILAPLTVNAQVTTSTDSDDQEINVFWGYRCASTDSKTVTTIALQHGKVISITVLPDVDGQIIAARATTLKEIGQNRYAGTFKPMLVQEQNDSSDAAPAIQPRNYEMTFKTHEQREIKKDEAPKIEEASLKENGIAPVNLNCVAIFQNNTHPVAQM